MRSPSTAGYRPGPGRTNLTYLNPPGSLPPDGTGGGVVEFLGEAATVPHRSGDGPRGFYRRLGFVPTGEIDDGEVVAVLAP